MEHIHHLVQEYASYLVQAFHETPILDSLYNTPEVHREIEDNIPNSCPTLIQPTFSSVG